MSASPLRVNPPGPFPPHGDEPPGVVDLGVRLREAFYVGRLYEGPARDVLSRNLQTAARSPSMLAHAHATTELLLDTWPLAATIDDSRERWRRGPDPEALATMARAAEVVSAVLGWPRSLDRHWPLPDEAWMRRQVLNASKIVVVPRGESDGAPAAAVALDAWLEAPEPWPLPPVLEAHGDEIVDDLERLLAALANGSAAAIRFGTPVPSDPASRAALDTLRDSSPSHAAYERYGLAGLDAGSCPTFAETLNPAPPGVPGIRLKRRCDMLLLPTLGPDRKVQTVGAIAWRGPHPPMRVTTGAIAVLQHLDGKRTVDEVARALDAPLSAVRAVVGQLVANGAATAA